MSPDSLAIAGAAAVAAVAVTGLGALVRALRAQRQELARLRDQIGADPLTGLANRRAWDEQLPRELARSRRTGRPVSLVLADLDGFKALNDTHGHQAGDRLLREVAAAWRRCLREVDVIARLGGDEFGFILPDCPRDGAMLVAERLRMAVPDSVGCSFGVAAWDGYESAAELTERADHALYEAKRGGRDRVVAAPDIGPLVERMLRLRICEAALVRS